MQPPFFFFLSSNKAYGTQRRKPFACLYALTSISKKREKKKSARESLILCVNTHTEIVSFRMESHGITMTISIKENDSWCLLEVALSPSIIVKTVLARATRTFSNRRLSFIYTRACGVCTVTTTSLVHTRWQKRMRLWYKLFEKKKINNKLQIEMIYWEDDFSKWFLNGWEGFCRRCKGANRF